MIYRSQDQWGFYQKKMDSFVELLRKDWWCAPATLGFGDLVVRKLLTSYELNTYYAAYQTTHTLIAGEGLALQNGPQCMNFSMRVNSPEMYKSVDAELYSKQ